MISEIKIERNVVAEMSDGARLRADIYRPANNGRYPAILMRTPYNKLMAGQSDFFTPYEAAFDGYVVVIQDVRGRFASDKEFGLGQDQNPLLEIRDGCETVDWIVGQPWCDGSVGMAGPSWLGMLQWMTASARPAGLKAISPWIGPSGVFIDETIISGKFLLHLWANWTAAMGVDMADKLGGKGRDSAQMRARLYHALSHPEEVWSHLPLKDAPPFQDEPVRSTWRALLGNANPTAEKEKLSTWDYSKIQTPVFQVSGWFDLYTEAVFKNMNAMRVKGGSPGARAGQHVVVGPWAHGTRLASSLGDMHYGFLGSAVNARLGGQVLTFFDKYLKGMEREIPTVRYFVTGENAWREAEEWPLPNARWTKWFLHSRGRANSSAGDGRLLPGQPGGQPPDRYVYDPLDPPPTVGGRLVPQANLIAGARRQDTLEQREDVLVYTSAPLARDTEVSGPVSLLLYADSSAQDTDFAVKFVDVHPGGQAYNVADGMIRALYRESVFAPRPLTPGEVCEFTINLRHISHLFRKGHCLRISICSANFPAYARSINTMDPVGWEGRPVTAVQKVWHNAQWPSHLLLPVIPRA